MRGNPKAEGRQGNPKAEGRNPKEARSPKSETRSGCFVSDLVPAFGYWPLAVRSFLSAIDDWVSFLLGSLLHRPAICRISRSSRSVAPSGFGFPRCRRGGAFTLIELLIVIAIMSILAALIFPITGAVSRAKIKSKARTELEQVATGIDLYKAKLGHYPPDNPANAATNQLYFELLGTTFTNQVYTTLDGSGLVTASSLGTVYGTTNGQSAVGGFINTTQGAVAEEGRQAIPFLKGLKPGQVALINNSGGNQAKILVSSVPNSANRLNTICYVSSNPTNNPNSYDLWVDVLINGVTNRISNWNKDPIINP